MKKVKFLNTLVLASLLIVFSAINLSAQNPKSNKAHMKAKRARMEQQDSQRQGIPNLTEEQRDKIKEIRINFKQASQELTNEIQELEAKLHSLKTVEKPDMKAVYAQIDKISVIKVKLEKKRADMEQDIRKLLDKEQKLFFDNHMKKEGRKDKRKEKPARRQDRPSEKG